MEMTNEPNGYQWALPENLEVPKDKLEVRLDFYRQSVVMYVVDGQIITTKMVSARDVALAMLREVPLGSELLPEGALWWSQGNMGPEVALWRPPQVWRVALQLEAFKPPRRFDLPLPGLIFVCRPGTAPTVFAAKKRPTHPDDIIYHAPLFNVFSRGNTCAGSHKYPSDISEIPGSFMVSFFSKDAQWQDRSKKYPKDLLKRWEELDGKKRYPLRDLVPAGKVADLWR